MLVVDYFIKLSERRVGRRYHASAELRYAGLIDGCIGVTELMYCTPASGRRLIRTVDACLLG